MSLNPPRHIFSVESPRLWDQCLALPVCPAVTPPCESAVHAHPVLLSSLRPFWCFPASLCQTGKGKPGQWPELSVFPFCAAVLPGRAAMEGCRSGLPRRHGDSWALLAGFREQGSKTTFPMSGRQEATCIPGTRAFGHSEVSLSRVLQYAGSETVHVTWHGPYCDSIPSAHSNGSTSELHKRWPQLTLCFPLHLPQQAEHSQGEQQRATHFLTGKCCM